MKKTIVIGLLSILTAYANAGEFRYSCSTNVDCNNLFTDLVSEKFMNRYPAKNWEIYVLSDSLQYTNAGASGVALVGVRRYRADGLFVVPKQRYARHQYSPSVSNSYEQNDFERQMIRNALEVMMADCDSKPNCNINY